MIIPPFLISGGDAELSIAGSTLRQLLFHRLREDKRWRVVAEDLDEGGPTEALSADRSSATLTGTVSPGRNGWGTLQLSLAWRPAGKHLLITPIDTYDYPVVANGPRLALFRQRCDAIAAAAYRDVLWVLGRSPDSPFSNLDSDTLHLYLLA